MNKKISDEISSELGKYVNKNILINLKNHKTIQRILINFDSQVNLVLGKEDYVANHDKKAENPERIVMRGGSILIISLKSDL